MTFVSVPNFEAPADANGDNIYEIQVAASDGVLNDVQAVTITVTDQNDVAPTITSSAARSVNENTTSVGAVTATDPDTVGTEFGYAISGGADASLFTIDESGNLSFVTAPNFEAPGDANADNVYQVQVAVSDGANTTTQLISVTVNDQNDVAPTITSSSTPSVDENTTFVVAVTANDPDTVGAEFGYAIAGGADASLFTIDAAGNLSFVTAPDFEAPADADENNVYHVEVAVSDGVHTTTQLISVTVDDENNVAPTIVSATTGTVAENAPISTVVYDAAATDDGENTTLAYSITGGADAALFAINGTTGEVTFLASRNFEAPGDADGNNLYEIEVTASDGSLTDTQAVTINVTDQNDVAPLITSGDAVTVAENTPASTVIYTTIITDPDTVGTITYSLSGADAALFSINTSGQVRFLAPPDFEVPADVGADNTYNIVVHASDGVNIEDTQGVTISVTNSNLAPDITSGTTAIISENVSISTAVYDANAIDDNETGSPLTYSITGGADAALFAIDDATGEVSFLAPPNFELPTDANGDNIYELQVTASDGALTDVQPVAITVTDQNDVAVVITSGGTVNVAENTLASSVVYATTVTDPDTVGTVTFSLTGTDATLFGIDNLTGEVRFLASPDFEAPADAGADNVYDIVIHASDGVNPEDIRVLQLTVTDVVSAAPTITSGPTGNVDEEAAVSTVVYDVDAINNSENGSALTYAITGGADATLFNIDGSTGEVTFVSSPDFEAPQDADADNAYEIEVTASDGSLTDVADVTITVNDVDDTAPAVGPPTVAGIVWQNTGDGQVATGNAVLGTQGDVWQFGTTGDFDGDGDSDIVWHRDDGHVQTWLVEGGTFVPDSIGDAPTTWHITGSGDFDGDGDDDIVWRHDDGMVVTWEMENGDYVLNHNLASVPANWNIEGTGDFDGDGDDDIVWRHSEGLVVTWEMEDGEYVQNHNHTSVPTNWQIEGTGDFDNDGDADILWRHDDGTVLAWEMQAGEHLNHHHLATVPNGYQFQGTTDLDADGDSDIVWRQSDGAVVTWNVEAGAILQTTTFDQPPTDNVWEVRGTGAFPLA